MEVEPVAAVRRDQLHLVDVEAELVEPANALLQAEPLGRGEHLGIGELRPEPLVAETDLERQLVRGEGQVELSAAELAAEIEELAGEILLGDRQVVRARPSESSPCSSLVSASTR